MRRIIGLFIMTLQMCLPAFEVTQNVSEWEKVLPRIDKR